MHPTPDQLLGAVVGLAVADAAAPPTPAPAAAPSSPSPFDHRPGVWGAGTAMARCLGTSLLETGRMDPADQLDRYRRWWREGYLSATGRCLGIGVTTRQALQRFENGDPAPGNEDPRTAGCASLLRLAPVVVWAHRRPELALALARESALTTHAAAECLDACEFLAGLLVLAWAGADLDRPLGVPNPRWSPALRSISMADYRNVPASRVPRSDYVLDIVAGARQVMAGSGSFEEAIERATAMGGRSNAVTVVTGQLAGARWGLKAIPRKRVARLVAATEISTMAERLVAEGPRELRENGDRVTAGALS